MNTIKRIKWHHSIEKRLVIIFVFAMTLMFGIMTSISMYAAHNEKKEQEEAAQTNYQEYMAMLSSNKEAFSAPSKSSIKISLCCNSVLLK